MNSEQVTYTALGITIAIVFYCFAKLVSGVSRKLSTVGILEANVSRIFDLMGVGIWLPGDSTLLGRITKLEDRVSETERNVDDIPSDIEGTLWLATLRGRVKTLERDVLELSMKKETK